MAEPKNKPSSRIDKELQNLKEKAASQDRVAETLVLTGPEADSKTRHEIAKRFVIWYFSLFLLILAGVPAYNVIAHSLTHSEIYKLDLIEIVQSYSAVVGPLIGFVIAYYFKDKNTPN